MQLLDHKEGQTPKNWWFWTVVLEKPLESPLDCKAIKPVNPKGNQSWVFMRRTDAKADAPILWSPDVKSQFIRKDYDAGKDWRQEERGTTKNKPVGWHHWLNGHEFEQAPEYGEGHGSLVCCSPWDCKDLGTTEWLNWTELNWTEGGSVVKNPPANEGDADLIPGWGRSPGEGNGSPLQYYCLGNPMDRVAWLATVHGVAHSQTCLSA